MDQTSEVTRALRPQLAALPARELSDVVVVLGCETGGSSRSLTIGSSKECEVRLVDPGVAGRHAEVYAVGDLWWVRDLGSESGTFLDGELVDAAPIVDGSELRVGCSVVALRIRSLPDS